MAEVRVNWSTARVKDAKLRVELDGEIARRWKESFETTERLLSGGSGGDWGEIRVKQGGVRISEVNPGSEEKLRHHLESLVAQANVAVRPREPEAEQPGPEPEAGQPGPGNDRDAQMTERFRAFAVNATEEVRRS